jgi:hypothetical protein
METPARQKAVWAGGVWSKITAETAMKKPAGMRRNPASFI